METIYIVEGMTCGHCEAAVAEEVREVAGVEAVEVDLESGRVTVHGEGFTEAKIREAVDDAGYEVVGRAA